MAKKSVQDQKGKVLENGKAVGKGRPIGTLIKLFQESESVEELKLTPNELVALIDKGSEIDEQRREIEKEVKTYVDPIKKLLKAHAEAHDWKHKDGVTGQCDISGSTDTVTGTATELKDLLKKEGKLKLFDLLLSVKITDAKKFLGEDILFKSKFFKSEFNAFGRVALKEKK